MAKLQGEKSTLAKRKRGCVIASQNKVISTGVSSHLTNDPNHAAQINEEERYIATVNAEMVAISEAVKAASSLNGCTIYSSTEPNWVSFKLIAMMGLKRVCFYGPLTNERTRHYAQELGIELVIAG